MHGGILYKSKYGSTEQYAQWLSHDLHLPILDIDNVSEESIMLQDFFIIGSPVYIGKILAGKWLRKHESILKNKKIFLFLVCGTEVKDDNQVARILRENLTVSLQKSCVLFFLPGRIVKKNLSWLDRILLKACAKLEKDPVVRSHMMEDFDAVDKANLKQLKDAIRLFNTDPKFHPEFLYTKRSNGFV